MPLGFSVFLAFFARLASLVALKTLVIPRSLVSSNREIFVGFKDSAIPALYLWTLETVTA